MPTAGRCFMALSAPFCPCLESGTPASRACSQARGNGPPLFRQGFPRGRADVSGTRQRVSRHGESVDQPGRRFPKHRHQFPKAGDLIPRGGKSIPSLGEKVFPSGEVFFASKQISPHIWRAVRWRPRCEWNHACPAAATGSGGFPHRPVDRADGKRAEFLAMLHQYGIPIPV